jgi:hypothetical protein
MLVCPAPRPINSYQVMNNFVTRGQLERRTASTNLGIFALARSGGEKPKKGRENAMKFCAVRKPAKWRKNERRNTKQQKQPRLSTRGACEESTPCPVLQPRSTKLHTPPRRDCRRLFLAACYAPTNRCSNFDWCFCALLRKRPWPFRIATRR